MKKKLSSLTNGPFLSSFGLNEIFSSINNFINILFFLNKAENKNKFFVDNNGNIGLKCPLNIMDDSKHLINSSSFNGNCLHILTISLRVSFNNSFILLLAFFKLSKSFVLYIINKGKFLIK